MATAYRRRPEGMPEDVTGEILGVDASVVRKAGQDVTGAAHPQPATSGVEEQSWVGGSARPGRALVVDPDAELLSQFRVQGLSRYRLPLPERTTTWPFRAERETSATSRATASPMRSPA